MKYRLIGKNDWNNPIDTILKNRNIKKSLFNLNEEVEEDYNGFDNISKGVVMLLHHLKNNNKIEIIVDCDVDGNTSSAILWRYIKKLYPDANLTYKIHSGKKHGLSEDIIIDTDSNLVVLADGLSNDYDRYDQLKSQGKDILILDHHKAKKYSDSALVINNQLSKKINNKNLSGAGVVYKFCKAIDDYLYEYLSVDYLDLVCLGNIADVMDLKEEETRFYVYKGFIVSNPFIKALIEVNDKQLEGKYNINKIGWVIAPKINGVIRSGNFKEREDIFKAFISDDYDFCLEVANNCKKIKEKQDREVKSSLDKIVKTIDIKETDRCLVLDITNKVKQPHTGLVAQKLVSLYGIPVLLYRQTNNQSKQGDNESLVGGSFRTADNITKTLMSDLQESNLVVFAEGHPGAGGWSCMVKNLENLKRYLDELYKDREVIKGKDYEVDFILQQYNLEQTLVSEISKYENEWGNKIDKPLIAIENVLLNIDDSNVKRPNLVFKINNISCVKKFVTNDLVGQLKNKELEVNIIGSCTINPYNNKGQIEIEDIEVI